MQPLWPKTNFRPKVICWRNFLLLLQKSHKFSRQKKWRPKSYVVIKKTLKTIYPNIENVQKTPNTKKKNVILFLGFFVCGVFGVFMKFF